MCVCDKCTWYQIYVNSRTQRSSERVILISLNVYSRTIANMCIVWGFCQFYELTHRHVIKLHWHSHTSLSVDTVKSTLLLANVLYGCELWTEGDGTHTLWHWSGPGHDSRWRWCNLCAMCRRRLSSPVKPFHIQAPLHQHVSYISSQLKCAIIWQHWKTEMIKCNHINRSFGRILCCLISHI